MRPLAGSVGVILAVIFAGFVAQRIFGSDPISLGEAREAIEEMPYRVSIHQTAEGVLVGTARGGDGVVLHFAASDEGPEPHDIPPHLIQVDKDVGGSGDFWVWDDSEFWLRHGTEAAWHEAAAISVDIEEALCRKATGDACPV